MKGDGKGVSGRAGLPPPSPWVDLDGVRVERNLSIPMRDGSHISADLYLPVGGGSHPALYAVSPYCKEFDYLPALPTFHFRETGDIGWFVRNGYAYVRADVRGSGRSLEGIWRLHDVLEQHDMYDTIEWIAEQAWCTGKVGMVGQSYFGATQWLAAVQNPPHLACIAPYDAYADYYRDMFFHGGIWAQEFAAWWSARTRARTLLDQPGDKPDGLMSFDIVGAALTHPLDGEFWRERSAYWRLQDCRVPTYSIGNWTHNALHLRGNLLGYQLVSGPKKLMIYGGEGFRGSIDFFYGGELGEELLRWYDFWLRGLDNGVMDEPRVKVRTRPGGGWVSLADWPPPAAEARRMYLGGARDGAVKRSLVDGILAWEAPAVDAGASAARSSYAYPSEEWTGWPGAGVGVAVRGGGYDFLAKIATFTSEPLVAPLEVLGPIALHLWASSDQTDTDFYVRLADEDAEGNTVSPPVGITRGWLKASHRRLDAERSTSWQPFHAHSEAEELQPGLPYEFEIEVWSTSWRFEAGHRIRVELAPGDSPVLDGSFNHEYGVKKGTDTVWHDREHPSYLVLPVLPAEASA